MEISTNLDTIRSQIQNLHKTNPEIHINLSLSSPKTEIKNACAKITNVYKHIFQIKVSEIDRERNYTFQYTDVLLGSVEIKELENKQDA